MSSVAQSTIVDVKGGKAFTEQNNHMPPRAKTQPPAPDAFPGFTPSKPFDLSRVTETAFAGSRSAADPAQEV